jgi:hypothetical protein
MLVSFLFVLLSTNELSAQAAFLRSQQNLWGFNSGASSDAMNAVFGSGNWDDLRFETVNAGDLFANHDFIYMEGGDQGANEMEAFIQANQAAMESWVSSGGHLLINAAPNEGDGMSYGFGISLTYPSLVDMGEAVDTNHPAYDGVASVIDGSYYGHAIVCPAGMTGITKDEANDNNIVFAEMPYGNGLVEAGGATLPYFGSWTPQPDASNFVNNLVGYAAEGANTCSIELTCPEDAVVECGDDTSVEALGNVSFENTCDDEAIVEVTEEYTEGCPAILERTFTVSVGDLSESCTQTIEIFDLDAPELDEFVAELTVSCLEEVPAPEQLSATDACSEETVEVEAFESNTGELVSSCDLSTAFGPGDDWSVWLNDFSYATSDHFVWDANGGTFDQFADGTAHLYGTVVNDMNPSESFIVDFWFQNASDWNTWSAMGRLYKDDLGIAGTNYEDWTYYEMADGFSTLTGLGDFAGDVLNFYHMPSDYTFGFQIGEAANNKNTNYGLSGWFTYTGTVDGEYVEGHGDVNVDAECEEQQESDCPNNTEFTYLYRAFDDCGNQVVEAQTIIVNDETAPEFTVVPEDFTVECDQLPVELFEGVEAEDNCVGDVSIEYVGEVQEGEGCEYTLTRTWIAEDICGNSAIHEQVITVVDTTAPEFTFVPEDLTYECDEEVAVVMAEAEDNCQDVEVTYEDDVSGDSCETIITRTFFANDGCENVATATQIITVLDTQAPIFDPYDVQLFVECDETDQIFVSAQDNCQEVEITYEDQLQSGGCLGVLVRTYTANDGCGNESTATQYITITDTTAPVIVGVPEDATVECDEVPTPQVTATDACGYDVNLEFNEEIIEGDCPQNYTIVWTWVATDYCENVSEASATIVVEDTTSPVFTSFPENEVVECSDELPEVVYPTADDNCGEVNIEMTEEIVDGECESEYTLNRIFRGFDECGNEVIAVQSIEVVDTTAPEFLTELSDETYECDAEIAALLPAASDNCSDVEVSYSDSEEVMNEECPQAYSFVRTYTAVDACGNESSISHTIFVEDTTAPVFGEYEIEIEMACDNIVATELPVSDNCGEVSVSYSDESVSGGCAGRIIRTFVAVDECGNESSVQQFITLIDEVAPVFTSFPEDIDVECNAVPSTEGVQIGFEDNCTDVTLSYDGESIIEGDCAGQYTIERTWTITDACDNATSQTQTINVIDTTAPELFVPSDAAYSCDEEINFAGAEYSDNCSEVTLEVAVDTIAGDCAQNFTIVRTFTASDDCGNSTVDTQEISVSDETAPDFTFVPADATVECDVELPVDMAEASDNCGSVSVSFEDSVDESTCETVITRTFTAIDECGNAATAEQIITVVDTTAPVIEGEIEVDMACDNIDDSILIEATDNCNEVTITFTEDGVSGGCAGRIIRDYVATDACGNTSTFQQIITLIDEVAPVFTSFPEDLTVECNAVPSADGVQIGFDDNCTDVTLSYGGETIIDGECAGQYTIVRTWTITDACENATSQTQTINVIDTTAPELFIPSDAAYSCDEEINYAGAEYSDNCSEVTLEVAVDTIAGDCAQNFTIVRTFTASDDCGNSTVDTQQISVSDETAPEFTFVPENATIECDTDLPVEMATAEDNCGEVTVSYEDYDLITPWVFSTTSGDGSGVVTEDGLTLVSSDSGTEESQIVALTSAAKAITISFDWDYSTVDVDGAPFELFGYTVDGVFTQLSDNAGSNNQSGSASFEVPAGSEVAFIIDAIDDILGSATANVTNINIEAVELECPIVDCFIREFTAVDECGNATVAQQFVTIEDTTAPVIEGEIEVDMACDNIDDSILIEATDNCSEVDITYTETGVSGGCAGRIIRDYVATDACGNSAEFQQIITLIDEVAPVFTSFPEDIDVECNAVPSTEGVQIEFEDNCTDVTLSYGGETIIEGDCAGQYTIERTWTITDACENATSQTQTINVIDTTAPQLYVPYDAAYSCDEEINYAGAEYSDNCSEVTLEVAVDTIAGDCAQNFTIVRTFTAIDACGNSTVDTQEISVSDETAPEFTFVPENATIECSEEVPAVMAEASDNCGEVTVSYEDAVAQGDCPQASTITRTFTAVDECGNASSAVQTINIVDTTAPVFDAYEAALEMACDNVMETSLSATDNCSDVEISMEESFDAEVGCVGTITRVFTAVDACGNAATAEQVITLTDDVAPELQNVPEDMTVECSDLPTEFEGEQGGELSGLDQILFYLDQMEVPFPTATDNCSEVVVDYEPFLVTEGLECPVVATGGKVFTVTDDCGNTVEHTFTVTIVDTVAPEFEYVPADAAYSCDAEYTLEDAIAFDSCSDASVEVSEEIIPGDCENNYSIVRTFTATDACGNSAEATQTIVISDEEAPVFTSVPQGNEISCDEELPTEMATAEDNCGDATVTFEDVIIEGDCANSYVVERTFTAVDVCGNSASASVSYYVYDNTAPVFDSVPENVTVECEGDVPAFAVLTATDNCGDASVQMVADTLEIDECGNMVIDVNYTATDACFNSSSASYTITVEDTTAPVFVSEPEDLVLDCNAEVPAADELVAIDNCDSDVTVEYSEEFIGEAPAEGSASDCIATDPQGVSPAWSLWLQDFANGQDYYVLAPNTTASWVTYPDGSAILTGQVVSTTNPNNGWTIEVEFENGMDWTSWSSQPFPTNFKDDNGFADNDPLYEDWTYYIMNGDNASLTGTGGYAGSFINLTHAPSNLYYAFQEGIGANNRSEAYGIGGWFYYDGVLIEGQTEQEAEGAGDFAFELDCCPQYEIVRTWTATDCSGNTTSVSQNISFDSEVDDVPGKDIDNLESALQSASEGQSGMTTYPNPATEKSTVTFNLNEDDRALLEVYNLAGTKVAEIFKGQVEGGEDYKVEMDVRGLPTGIYIYRLTTGKEVLTKRLIITK